MEESGWRTQERPPSVERARLHRGRKRRVTREPPCGPNLGWCSGFVCPGVASFHVQTKKGFVDGFLELQLFIFPISHKAYKYSSIYNY